MKTGWTQEVINAASEFAFDYCGDRASAAIADAYMAGYTHGVKDAAKVVAQEIKP